MSTKRSVIWLGGLTAVAALVVSAVGLFWRDGGSSYSFTTLYGETVEIYGQGLYRHDTLFKAPLLRGTNAVTLFVALPLLVRALLWARRGELHGQLFLTGMLSFFLYNAISLAFGASYNPLFIVYLMYLSASLFAFVLACLSVDLDDLPARVSPSFPHRLTAAFLILAGLSVFVWLVSIVQAILQGQIPHGLEIYTTEVTYLIDLGILAPTAFLAASLVLRRRPMGYLLSAIILTLNALIGPVIIGQTVMQNLAGVEVAVAELIVFVGIFIVTSLIAAALLANLLLRVGRAPHEQARR